MHTQNQPSLIRKIALMFIVSAHSRQIQSMVKEIKPHCKQPLIFVAPAPRAVRTGRRLHESLRDCRKEIVLEELRSPSMSESPGGDWAKNTIAVLRARSRQLLKDLPDRHFICVGHRCAIPILVLTAIEVMDARDLISDDKISSLQTLGKGDAVLFSGFRQFGSLTHADLRVFPNPVQVPISSAPGNYQSRHVHVG